MDIKDIEKLAELAKIELNNDEKEKILKDLDGVLGYVKQVSEVEVGDVEVDYKHKNIWREDEERNDTFSKNLIINQFPDLKDNFVRVKKIL